MGKFEAEQMRTFIWLRSKLKRSKKPADLFDLEIVEDIINSLKQKVRDEVDQ